MINTLRISLKIDMTYAINSFIYSLKRLPILKELFPDNSLYKSEKAKRIIRILGIILSTGRLLLYKALYFGVIYWLAKLVAPENLVSTIIHIYVMFTAIGIFINNKVLTTSTKKYFSIILFNMNAKKFMKSTLWFDLIINFITHSIGLAIITKSPVALLLALVAVLGRVIGEGLNLAYYKKYKLPMSYNYSIFWFVVIVFLALCLLPKVNIVVSLASIVALAVIMIPIAILSYCYLMRIPDYKLIYKKLNTRAKVMNSSQEKEYNRQSLVEVRDKDKLINNKKLKNKKGYDLFNTIFFERHREILLRSAKKFALACTIIIVGTGIAIMNVDSLQANLNKFLLNNISWFVIVMYFINRGAIITQAMFFNCDHAMLSFNFYRNPKVILNVFKTRVLTVVKVNLIPAILIAIGLPILLYLSGGTTTAANYLAIPIFIISLSIFFSVHYLVIYYLFQPYDKNMKVKSMMYSIISAATYFIAYMLTDLKMSTIAFSTLAVVATITYSIIALAMVYKKSPATFKVK